MVGGVWARGGVLAVLTAGLLASAGTTTASAADLGGDCCADLEERIAELEATTARKGNRKVSLEIYGQVNQSVIYWDDGFEDNAYVVTNDNSRSRIGFRGKAKIDGDWEAGYRLEIGIRTANSKRFTQSNPIGNDTSTDVGLDTRDAYWYVKSKTYGAVSLGTQAAASDAITESNLTQTKDFAKYSDVEDTGLGLFLRSSNGGLSSLSYRRLLIDSGDQPGEGDRRQDSIKYESPTFAGFTASASWGGDDYWDIALRYAGEFGGFKVAAAVGFLQITDGPETKHECQARGGGIPRDEDCQHFGGSFSVVHESTGLFLNAGAGTVTDDVLNTTARFAGTNADDEANFWSVQAGIEKKWLPLGKTTIYGEYYDYEGGAINRGITAGDAVNIPGFGASSIWNTGLQVYGFGLAQGLDNAATVLYLSYRHVSADLTLRDNATGALGNADIEDLDLVNAGAIIKF
ncbi:MAG: porin [Hyphomicrobium sp.]|jgi:predicted porin|uniref:porin n=1 Tax=Hyphomicrobium sp. TaxID=82 RepID=UPI0025C2E3AC|nr:porin [Hyphomicrobium sp.]MBX9861130.1 porin [Hyphomicrobium sp.]